MPRYSGFLITALTMLLLAAPASALSRKEKMETCKIGADAQKLTGSKRNAFIRNCMAQAPAQRATASQKMETCKVGAEAQKLTGGKRNAFIKKCMARGNYEPPARRALKQDAMKKPAMKKPPPKQN